MTSGQLIALQRTAGNAAVGRLLASRSASEVAAGGTAVPEVGEGIEATRAAGRPLDAGLAARGGQALGTDLSAVRVHTDPDADLLTRSLGARAFTAGSDLYFRAGQYQPEGDAGRRLLAHELTHVRQQGGQRRHAPQGKLEVAAAHDPSEVEADRMADVVAGRLAGSQADGTHQRAAGVARDAGASAQPAIQRALGFEFQTGWGLVRSLPAPPLNPRAVRADDPDPKQQGDWEDVAVTHALDPADTSVPAPTRALPPTRSWKDKLMGRNKAPTLGASPMMPSVKNIPMMDQHNDQWLNAGETQYMTKKGAIVAGPTANRVHYKFHKGQILKDYGPFKMTVDDATTPLGAELEWVVDPPISDSASVKDVAKIMTGLQKAASQLLVFKDRESFLLSEVTKRAEDDQVELQPGVKGSMRNMSAAAQATGGVSIDQLITLFRDLGSVGVASGPNVPKTELSGGAPAKAMAEAGVAIEGSDRLRGLVAFIHRYLSMGAGATPLSYAKVNTQFLARTDFAAMFSLLPDDELGKYGGAHYLSKGGGVTNPDDFVALVRTAMGGVLNEDRKIFVGGVKSGGGVKDIPLTIGDWLRGIADGKDLLSGKYWKGIAEDDNTSNTDKVKAEGMRSEMESMGNLGSKRDRVGANAADIGIIMEFRSNTNTQTVAEWKPYALAVFKYLKELNRK